MGLYNGQSGSGSGNMVLLWTNPNMTDAGDSSVSFPAQTIPAITDNLDYDFFIMRVRFDSARGYDFNVILPKDIAYNDGYGAGYNISSFGFSPSTNNKLINARRVCGFANHILTVREANGFETYGAQTPNDKLLIPYKIYGVKL